MLENNVFEWLRSAINSDFEKPKFFYSKEKDLLYTSYSDDFMDNSTFQIPRLSDSSKLKMAEQFSLENGLNSNMVSVLTSTFNLKDQDIKNIEQLNSQLAYKWTFFKGIKEAEFIKNKCCSLGINRSTKLVL